MRRESFSLLRPKALRGRPDAPPAPTEAEGQAVLRPFGVDRLDEWLGGGLRGDGLHELFADGTEDLSAALAFAALVALAGRGEETLLWLRRPAKLQPYGPGLAALGVDPDRITLVSLSESRDLLRAALDTVRTAAASAVLLELSGRQPLLDLTATRRLVLAAARTGTLVLVVRAGAEPGSSAAHSRWRVRSAPSTPLPADAPGAPVFDLDLLRHRGGRDGLGIRLEWNRDTGHFREWQDGNGDTAPLSGGVAAVAAGGERPPARHRAA